MSNNGFEILIGSGAHTSGSETDSNLFLGLEPGFEVGCTKSDAYHTLSDSIEEQQSAHDDKYVGAELVHNPDVEILTLLGEIHSEPWSVPESPIFTEAILSSPIFLKSLKADEILHLKDVCKSWRTWFHDNIDIIAKVRHQNESFDWYFPIIGISQTSGHLFPWTWLGIWHGAVENSLELQPRLLPSLDCVRHTWRKWSHPETIAIAGGLLLLRFVRVNVPTRICLYCNYCGGKSDSSSCRFHNKKWEPLMVVNPLRNTIRFLPAPVPDRKELTRWGLSINRSIQVLMRVDDKANSYEVILLHNDWELIYSSTSDKWKFFKFHAHGPWQRNPAASTWVGQRLFVAHIRFPQDADYIRDPHIAGVLQVFEIDVEAGDWRPLNNFPLHSVTIGMQIPTINLTSLNRIWVFNNLIALQNLELVECMGHIFAVIPARVDEYLYPWPDGTGNNDQSIRWLHDPPWDPKFMPLQFYILQLQGESLVHGMLRIKLEVSPTAPTIWSGRDQRSRRQRLLYKTKPENAPVGRPNWFSCIGKDSVIWVSIEDYLLQYDVVSGQTQTQVIPMNLCEDTMRFAYRPSFHMKP